ncbi:MAG: hypothetical protein GW780_05660, partial [Candidatus Aenigmarchaeota archaeon]|nr:hypothetical protein [Candidatus Aenigmarchaeota archaeon]
DEGFEDIIITRVTRQCAKCRRTFYPKSPFYPNCSYGKPLVDLILFLVAKNPFNRVETILLNFGLQIDRDSVKNYSKMFKDRVSKLAGIKMFDEDIGVNLLKLFFNVNNVQELKKKYPQLKSIESGSDETYPRKKGAKKALKEENKIRKVLGEEEKKYPNGFTTAVSYLPAIKSYASLIVTENPFSSMFAKLLGLPLIGSGYNLTDGHGGYNAYPDHERCLFHLAKNMAKKDKILKKLQKSAFPNEIKEYLKGKYQEMKEEMLKMMKEKHPDFVDPGGEFTGSLTTNCIEGGNWRIKHELRTEYQNINSIASRSILVTILDSLYTFRGGKPDESFAHANSSFKFEDAMGIRIKEEKAKMRFELPKNFPRLEFNPLSVRNMKW